MEMYAKHAKTSKAMSNLNVCVKSRQSKQSKYEIDKVLLSCYERL